MSTAKQIKNVKIKKALKILRSIDKRSIRFKNSWRHYLNNIESFLT